MSGIPTVSVVIPVLNGASTIGDTLAGVTNQAFGPCAAEILVVDNGSTDETRTIVQKFPVTLLTETKRGAAAARNRGLRAAHGEFVAHLDADTLPTRHWLAHIVAPFADANVTQVAGRMLSYRPSTAAERYYSRRFLDREAQNATAEGFPFAAAGNMAVRRDAALAVGGWDESFRVGQDVDLSYRLLRRFDVPIHYQPEALVFLRSSRTLAELKQRAFKYGQGRARLWLQYPEAAPWGPRGAARIAAALAVCGLWPQVARTARWWGYANDFDVQEAECHRAWNWWLWGGFVSMLRHRDWR